MNLKICFAAAFWLLLLAVSCNRDDISFDAPSQELRFSRDTVFLDTVYNQTRSETYAVKVYNKEDKDVRIPRISLQGGAASLFRINVDGKAGTEFTNVPLRKKDSLYIFVEIAPIANAPQAIAEDNIIFEGTQSQKVTLFSVVQDAEYFIKTDTNPNVLSANTTWKNNKAKIIYGDLTVAEGKTLTIEKGTKVYFHKNSGMKVLANAILNVGGDLGEEVIFRGDRSDTKYDTIPNNWNSISLAQNAKANINYARIFGGVNGLDMKNASAEIRNTIIHTFQENGILAENSTLTAQNLVMNNCGNADLSIYKGGNYNLTHSTFANFWNMNSGTSALGIFASNADEKQTTTAPLTLNIRNSIIFGNAPNAVVFKQNTAQSFAYLIQNSLLKYDTNGAGFNFDANSNVVASIKNENPKFENYFTHKLNLRVKADSPAKAKGNTAAAATVPLDIAKVSRTSSPTLGAYQ